MTRLEIAARLLAGWVANPDEDGTHKDAAAGALALADVLLDAAGETPAAPTDAAPAKPLAPVKFDAAGRAGEWARDGWDTLHRDDELRVTVYLRPGEDAGELAARMLASVGRTPWPT